MPSDIAEAASSPRGGGGGNAAAVKGLVLAKRRAKKRYATAVNEKNPKDDYEHESNWTVFVQVRDGGVVFHDDDMG